MPERRPMPRLLSLPCFLDPSRLSRFQIVAVAGLLRAAIIASVGPAVNRHLDAARRGADNVVARAKQKGSAMQRNWRIHVAAVIGLVASSLAAQAQQKSEIAVSR